MELFPITYEERQKIYKIYGTSEKQIDQDVEIIKEWLKKQPHLPQKLPYPNMIQQMLINNKFSVEKTKEILENHFTLKTMNEYYVKLMANPILLKPSEIFGYFYYVPKLGPQNERICLFRIHNPDVFNFEHLLFLFFTTAEFIIKYNCSQGIRFIMDYTNYSFEHFKKLDLVRYVKGLPMMNKAYSAQIVGIDVLNPPAVYEIILATYKKFVKPKIADRFVIHKNLDSLYQNVGPEYLPRQYGGTCGDDNEQLVVLDKIYEDHHKFFMDTLNYKTDESLRIGPIKYATVEGIDGTFKKLNID